MGILRVLWVAACHWWTQPLVELPVERILHWASQPLFTVMLNGGRRVAMSPIVTTAARRGGLLRAPLFAVGAAAAHIWQRIARNRAAQIVARSLASTRVPPGSPWQWQVGFFILTSLLGFASETTLRKWWKVNKTQPLPTGLNVSSCDLNITQWNITKLNITGALEAPTPLLVHASVCWLTPALPWLISIAMLSLSYRLGWRRAAQKDQSRTSLLPLPPVAKSSPAVLPSPSTDSGQRRVRPLTTGLESPRRLGFGDAPTEATERELMMTSVASLQHLKLRQALNSWCAFATERSRLLQSTVRAGFELTEHSCLRMHPPSLHVSGRSLAASEPAVEHMRTPYPLPTSIPFPSQSPRSGPHAPAHCGSGMEQVVRRGDSAREDDARAWRSHVRPACTPTAPWDAWVDQCCAAAARQSAPSQWRHQLLARQRTVEHPFSAATHTPRTGELEEGRMPAIQASARGAHRPCDAVTPRLQQLAGGEHRVAGATSADVCCDWGPSPRRQPQGPQHVAHCRRLGCTLARDAGAGSNAACRSSRVPRLAIMGG